MEFNIGLSCHCSTFKFYVEEGVRERNSSSLSQIWDAVHSQPCPMFSEVILESIRPPAPPRGLHTDAAEVLRGCEPFGCSTTTAPGFGLGTQGNSVTDETSSRHCSVPPFLVKRVVEHTDGQRDRSFPPAFRPCCDIAVNQVEQDLYPNSGFPFSHHSWKTA